MLALCDEVDGEAAFAKKIAGSGAVPAASGAYDGAGTKVILARVLHLPGEYYKARVNFLCGAANGVAVSATPLAISVPGHSDPVMCFDGPATSSQAVEVCGWVDDTAVNVSIRAADAATARSVAVRIRAAVEKPA